MKNGKNYTNLVHFLIFAGAPPKMYTFQKYHLSHSGGIKDTAV